MTVSAHNARETYRPLPANREPPHSLFMVLLALGPFGLGYFLSYRVPGGECSRRGRPGARNRARPERTRLHDSGLSRGVCAFSIASRCTPRPVWSAPRSGRVDDDCGGRRTAVCRRTRRPHAHDRAIPDRARCRRRIDERLQKRGHLGFRAAPGACELLRYVGWRDRAAGCDPCRSRKPAICSAGDRSS